MNYVKLIAIKVDDFQSRIVFEQNYNRADSELYNAKEKELGKKGLICIVAKIKSDLVSMKK